MSTMTAPYTKPGRIPCDEVLALNGSLVRRHSGFE